ncbi:MAG: hypothetical protein ACM3YE_00365 [Bacteroidota bacterium]
MSQKNLISFNIPEADLAEIKSCIATLQTKLMPHLIKLSPDERQELLKMGDKTVSFVQKTLEYCKNNPDLVPPFINVDELAVDVAAVETIRSIYQPMLQMTDSLSDTMALSGSESFSTSLMFYSAIKNAMRQNIQKAETIHNDLSARFPGRSRREQQAAG